MQLNLKALLAIGIAIIIIISGISIYYFWDTSEDKEPLEITAITGNISAKQGQYTMITVNFSDVQQISSALIFYRKESQTIWNNASIISGSYSISIPREGLDNWHYYVVVYDKDETEPIGNPSIDGSVYYTITVSLADPNDEQLVHTVFIEKATSTTCRYCPYVADKIHQLYTSGNYQFHYVNMVDDKNAIAKNRVENEYNNFGNPTTYIDGGYKVLSGGLLPLTDFITAINQAQSRIVPQIKINVTATYDEITDSFTTTVVLTNFEENSYNGRLRVYLTEKISRWNDYNGSKYRYGFFDYIINQEVSLPAREITEIVRTYDLTDLDAENLKIIAVLFSSQKQQGYAKPPDENPFDAYYADACDATDVVEGGDLPPEVGIISPQPASLYISGKKIEILKNIGRGNTLLFGKIVITAYASHETGIEKVELYIDEELYGTIEQEPYEWSFRTTKRFLKPFLPKQHTIKVIAYSTSGKNSTDSMVVWGRF
jgi:hypothetical protein